MSDRKSIKEQIEEYRLKYDLYEQILCTPEENKLFNELSKQGEKLPDDVYPLDPDWRNVNNSGKTEFCRLIRPELTQEDIMEYLMYKKLNMLKTIKNCLVFFTTLIIIVIIYFLIIAALN